MHLAKTTVRSMYAQAAATDDDDDRRKLVRWAEQSEQVNRMKAMLELAKSDPVIATDTTAFDADPDLLNVNNGIVHLPTGELLDHDPGRMCSRLAPVDYRPELLERDDEGVPQYVKHAPRFAQFITEITLARRDLAQYIQAVYGYGITGHAREQILPMFVGRGENGKGSLMHVTSHVLGDYYQAAPPSLVVEDKARGSASPEIARLYGSRLLEVEETNDGDRLHESKAKWLTGGDRLVARHLFGEYFEFDPTFTPVLVTNHKPRITDGGKSIWRRIRVVPFEFQPEVVDKTLDDQLRDEAAGVMAWLIEGAREWYRRGMPDSETVDAASGAYKSEEDRLEPFLDEATYGIGHVHQSKLYRAYCKWAESEGETPMQVKTFNAALRERGYEQETKRTYKDLSLKAGYDNV